MHLHFVQSLEPLQGAGLGQAALSLHLAMRGACGEAALGMRLIYHPEAEAELVDAAEYY